MPIADVFTAEEVTAEWLGHLLGKRVTALTRKSIGTGQVGSTVRFTLASPDPDCPPTLIGKFQSDDETSRGAGVAQGSYARETTFYRHLAVGRALPVPRALHVSFEPDTHRFAILMPDLGDHRIGDQLAPLGRSEAEATVRALAQVHAAFLDDPELDRYLVLPGTPGSTPIPLDPLYAMLWPGFLTRYGERVTPAMREVGEAYLGRCEAWAAPREGPRTLLHGDCRPDNLLFAPQGGAVLVDWQTAAVGSPATDLAYFAGTSLAVEARRAWENDLFALWARALPMEHHALLRHTYRRDAFAGFLMGVAASMLVVRTKRGDAMFLSMCERSAAMVLDHDAPALL